MNKILFLDIDGVLNSTRSVTAFGNYPHPHDIEVSQSRFDWVAVGLIRKLCQETGANIVLSSTWRKGGNRQKLAKILDLPIVGETPEKIGGHRGYEIAEWLKSHSPKKFAIVDDDTDMLESQLPFFVNTSHEEGLLYSDFKKLRDLLSIKPEKK